MNLNEQHKIERIDRPDLPVIDLVNHPPHYTQGGIEHSDVVVAWKLDYFLGQCTKYIARFGKKGLTPEVMLEDLLKSRWYLNRKISSLLFPDLKTQEAMKALKEYDEKNKL